MRFELLQQRKAESSPAAICRIPAEGALWRVQVETWPAAGGYQGRIIFEPDGRLTPFERRYGPPNLAGTSREETVAAAHELDERRLRELLHSLV